MDPVALIADIGGTNLRVALVDTTHSLMQQRHYSCRDFGSLSEAMQTYLADTGLAAFPSRVLLSAAGPVQHGQVRMTNLPWNIDASALSADLGIPDVILLNDFEAIAWSLPGLGVGDLRTVQPGTAEPSKPAIVLGPGTGLGVAAFIPGHGPIATEGGHMTLSAITPDEWQIVETLTGQFGHASFERVVSGMGLEALYRISSGLELSAAEISARAKSDTDPLATEAVRQFSVFLAAVAADVALAYGALGGVYLAGGILPRIIDFFPVDAFVARFTNKGRFSDYLRHIPVHIVTHPNPALLGLVEMVAADDA